jgi:hypothetical protein
VLFARSFYAAPVVKLSASNRARGGNRGGCGGGYEQTDPDFEQKRMARIHADYLALDQMWRESFLSSLPKADQWALDRLLHPKKYA